jgi:hypothetical protein
VSTDIPLYSSVRVSDLHRALAGIRIAGRLAAGSISSVLALIVLIGAPVCSKPPAAGSAGGQKVAAKTIEQVLDSHTAKWMSVPGVAGTAIGESDGRPCIKILVFRKTEELKKKIPSRVEGFPVILEEVGKVRALDEG